MKNTVLVDTSALIALGNKADNHHIQAKVIKRQLQQNNYNFVTSNAILLEFGNAFSPSHLRPIAVQTIKAIQESKQWTCVFIDLLIKEGLDLFEDRPDKDWGLVDCTSIVIAKERGISEIFTTDHHFEQAGFQILLPKD